MADDHRLFEKLCLESFQSGLSWRTILAKREGFRAAFADFDFDKIAKFGPEDSLRLLQDEAIVRHGGKIAAVLNNAREAQELVEEAGSLAAYIWAYEPAPTSRAPSGASVSAESIALAKDLKKRGWAFLGPTTVYAFMQAMGLVNDHAEGCVIREAAERSRAGFKPPSPGRS